LGEQGVGGDAGEADAAVAEEPAARELAGVGETEFSGEIHEQGETFSRKFLTTEGHG
jgi:hypothetical protein